MIASEIKPPEHEIFTRLAQGNNSIKARAKVLYQQLFSLANDSLHEKLLWSLDHTADSIGSPNSVMRDLESLSACCDFWQHYQFPAEIPWNITPRWNDISTLLGLHLKRDESTLEGKLYQLENINNSDGITFYETLGKPMDMLPQNQTFFAFLNQLSKYMIGEPLLTLFGRRVVGEHAGYIGVLKGIHTVSEKIEQLIQTPHHFSEKALHSLKMFKAAFGDLKLEKYYYPSSFTSLLCHTIVDIEQMFPAISINQLQEIVQCVNAGYFKKEGEDLSGSLDRLIQLCDRDISEDQTDALWQILIGYPEPQELQKVKCSPDSLFGKIIQARQILGRSILDVMGEANDDYRQQTMFGGIQLLKRKIGRYWETSASLQSRVDHLYGKMIRMKNIFEKNIREPIEFPFANIYTHLSQNWMLRMIETIASFGNATDLTSILTEDWVNTYIGFEDDYGSEDSLLSVLNQALKDVLAYPLIESVGELRKIDYLDSGTQQNLASLFSQIVNLVREREVYEHSEIANFLLTDVLGEEEQANKITLFSMINLLSSLVRNTYLEWEDDWIQSLLPRMAYSWSGQTSLPDLMEQIQQALPLEMPTEADLCDLRTIFQPTQTMLEARDIAFDWESLMPYMNAILKDFFPIFFKCAFGFADSRINFVERAPLFSWVNGLLHNAQTQQRWRHALPDDIQIHFQKYANTLQAIADLCSQSKYQIKDEMILDLYQYIGGIMYSNAASLRGLTHQLFKKLYNHKFNESDYIISQLSNQADQIYLTLCCPCIKIDALMAGCQLCIEQIAKKINESVLPAQVNMGTFVRNNLAALTLIDEKVTQLFDTMSDFIEYLVQQERSENDYYCKADDPVIHSFETVASLLAQISDQVNMVTMSVSPTFDYTQTTGYSCAHLAQSIQPLADSVEHLTDAVSQYFVRLQCFSFAKIASDQAQDYRMLLQKIAHHIMGCSQQLSNMNYLLIYEDQFLNHLCKSCLAQAKMIDPMKTLSQSCKYLSNQLIQIGNSIYKDSASGDAVDRV